MIKGMYILGENPAMSDPDVQHAREALAKLEHLVVQDLFFTENVLARRRRAAGLRACGKVGHLHQHQPPGADRATRAQSARGGASGLGPDPGAGAAYRTELELSATFPRSTREMAAVMPSLNNITWERLLREDAVTYPCDAADKPGNEIIFASSFPTQSGRARIVPADLLPPDELPDADYPLVLTTGRLLEHWHTGSMTRRASNLDSLEPEAIAGLNPREMDRLGVTPGGLVRVSTRRGTVVLKARADRDVAEGMVFLPFCFAEAAANLLTNPQLDPIGKIPEFKFCAAKVEPAAAPMAAE